uniref:(northern house mosquito) hypothetical protein n=1 Tax=Culex pipiens TaxID=7175 RepID=A0A8D8BPM1_CULPI
MGITTRLTDRGTSWRMPSTRTRWPPTAGTSTLTRMKIGRKTRPNLRMESTFTPWLFTSWDTRWALPIPRSTPPSCFPTTKESPRERWITMTSWRCTNSTSRTLT